MSTATYNDMKEVLIAIQGNMMDVLTDCYHVAGHDKVLQGTGLIGELLAVENSPYWSGNSKEKVLGALAAFINLFDTEIDNMHGMLESFKGQKDQVARREVAGEGLDGIGSM